VKASARLRPRSLPAKTPVGPYEIVERLSQDAGATVYRVRGEGEAYHLRLGSRRLGSLPPRVRARRRQEMARLGRALLGVRHPHLARVHALGCWPDPRLGYPYAVLEAVEGERLVDWCRRSEPGGAALARLFGKLASALDHLHGQGVAHGALSADGVVVRGEGDPVLVDCGVLSPAPGARASRSGRGDELERRRAADLRALGRMLHQALAGRPPGPGRRAGRSAVGLRQAPRGLPRAPSELDPRFPPALGELALRLLATDPERGPASAREVADELARAGGCASPASPPAQGAEASTLPRARPAEAALLADGGGEEPAAPAASPEARFVVPTLPGGAPFDAGTSSPPPAEAPRREEEELPTAIREMVARIEEGAPRRRMAPALLAGGGALVALLAALVALAARGQQAARRDPPPPVPPPPPASPSGALLEPLPGPGAAPEPGARRPSDRVPPRGTDARSVDEELEREFGRPRVLPDGRLETRREAPGPVAAPAPTADESQWLRRSLPRDPPLPAAGAPRPRGVPTGLHIRARLLTNLDSRTIGHGPVEAVLPGPALSRGVVVLPEGTLAFGTASERDGRFTVHFTRMRLPDDSELPFDGIAIAREDGKPGLPPAMSVEREVDRGEGAAARMAKGTGNVLLDAVVTGPVQGVARNAAELAFEREPGPAAPGRALLLDGGILFDIWVERAF